MPDYGWAYINLDVLQTNTGATGSVCFKTDETTISGTSAFIYATASHRVGLGINAPGLDVAATVPAYRLDVSASAPQDIAARFTGDVVVSGGLVVTGTILANSLHADTIISSSHLIVRDPVIGLGFGSSSAETGSVGDRGFIFGLAGNNNQALIWDQTSGSFVLGKVGATGPSEDAYDIPPANLSTFKAGAITGSTGVSGSDGRFHALRIGSTLTASTGVSASVGNFHKAFIGTTLTASTGVSASVGNFHKAFIGTTLTASTGVSASVGNFHKAFIGTTLTASTGVSGSDGRFHSVQVGTFLTASTGLSGTDGRFHLVNVGTSITAGTSISGTTLTSHFLSSSDTLFVQNQGVGIQRGMPKALLHISSSTPGLQSMHKPMVLIEHPADPGGDVVPNTRPILLLTASNGHGRLAINTNAPGGELDVRSDGASTLLVKQGNVLVGTDQSNAQLYVQSQNLNLFHVKFDNESNTADLLYVSGSHTHPFVGMGTTTPSASLHVSASQPNQITMRIDAEKAQTADILHIQNKAGAAAIKVDKNGLLSGSATKFHSALIGTTLTASVGVSGSDGRFHSTTVGTSIAAGTSITATTSLSGATVTSHFLTSSDTLFAQNGGVGIQRGMPQALFHISSSTPALQSMHKPMMLVEFPADPGGDVVPNTRPILLLTASNGHGRLAINTNAPGGELDVRSDGGSTLLVKQGNVLVGTDNSNAKLYVESDNQNLFHVKYVKDSDEANLLFVSGSKSHPFVGVGTITPSASLHVSASRPNQIVMRIDAEKDQSADMIHVQNKAGAVAIKVDRNGVLSGSSADFHQMDIGTTLTSSVGVSGSFGRFHSLVVSSAKMVGEGNLVEYLEAHDEDGQNVTLTAAEFKKGLIVHTTTTGAGTVTLDTAANLISALGLTADNMTAHCYYINDGDQDAVFSGAATGVTYADTGTKIKQNQGARVLVRRTGGSAVTVYVVGGS